MTQIDLNAKIISYPYVAPSISVLANSSTGASGDGVPEGAQSGGAAPFLVFVDVFLQGFECLIGH